jgi:hypothetical protein
MATQRRLMEAIAAGTLSAAIVASCATTPRDEAAQAGKTPADFPETTVDYFPEVDGGVALAPNEAAGRNTWILWTGGNQAFWDYLANHSFGTLDLLKTADSRYRYRRFDYYGLMNDPDCTAATEPDQYGLYLDDCPQPEGLDPEVYGRSAGVIGLRRFPNPNFDEAAAAAWDGERYYSDPEYYNNPELVRPYRLGMSCGFCHVSAHPLNPPRIRTRRNGATSRRRSAASISGSAGSSSPIPTRAISSGSCSTPRRPARSTPPSSPRTTSMPRERSTPSSTSRRASRRPRRRSFPAAP